MAAIRTRGQAAAAEVLATFVGGSPPHAVMLVGPGSVGKTTLALDLAAALLCRADDPAERPCGTCRGCRLVASGNHPDVHRLAPTGPGDQIRIGDPDDPEPGTVRWLIRGLSLLPLEGGARVAIVEHAERANEPAQEALLKTLEEPPGGVTIVLCTDDEEQLLPTVRSRCARVRLGPVGSRAIEAVLGDLGLADPPTAARLARLAAGRPGLAVAYARSPEAVAIRGEVTRALLDLLAVGPAARLRAIRELHGRALAATTALAQAETAATGSTGAKGRDRSRAVAAPQAADAARAGQDGGSESGAGDGEPAVDDAGTPAKRTAMERRRAAAWLLEAWRDLAGDLSLVGLGERHAVRDPGLLDELAVASDGLDQGAAARFLLRLSQVSEQLDRNVNPELALDVLVLAWPRSRAAA